MAEIDLIPASWRAEQQLRRHLRSGGLAVAAVLLTVLAGRIGLEWTIRKEQAAEQQLQGLRREGERDMARLTVLQNAVDEARQQQGRIATLRGEGLVASALKPLDDALEDGIWFDELRYVRQPVLPQPGNPAPPPPEASLIIRGKAPDAAAIARLTDALGAGLCVKPSLSPGEVKRYTRFELLEFSLTCPLRAKAGATP